MQQSEPNYRRQKPHSLQQFTFSIPAGKNGARQLTRAGEH
jgi:hypothetical protein